MLTTANAGFPWRVHRHSLRAAFFLPVAPCASCLPPLPDFFLPQGTLALLTPALE